MGTAPLVFDATQYRAEVQRASTERAWEAEPWQTALLLDQYLSAHSGALGGTWNLGWAEPHGEATGMFSVTLWDDHRDADSSLTCRQPWMPEERVRRMADLRRPPPGQIIPSQRRTGQRRVRGHDGRPRG